METQTESTITRKQFLRCIFLVLAVLPAMVSKGQEWTRFRGPNGQGISDAETIPVKWTEKDYNWKINLPGGGHSSPVLWGEKLFITSGDQKTTHSIIIALNALDGAVLWQKEYTLSKYRPNKLNSFASATPAVDANNVYVLFTSPEETILAALNHEGTEIWKHNFEGMHCQHGAGSSPIVVNDMVVFTHENESDGTDGKSAWIAVNRKTGQTKWALERKTSSKTSYSTPSIYSSKTGGSQLIFTSFAHGMTGVDPNTGTVSWEVDSAFISRVVSSPVIADGLLIGTCGDYGVGKRLIAIRPGTSDKSVRPTEAYKIENSSMPYVPTSLAKDGLLFTFHDRGDVSCLRSATGERLWQEKPAGRFFGSPVWADGKLYCITTDGDLVVVRAAETYELLAINPLRETSHSTPAISGGRMYLRTFSHLFSIGGKK
jgi:outer membrane protein assembly factor BamB